MIRFWFWLMMGALLLQPSSGLAAWELTAGLNYRNFDYKEDLRPPLKSSEKTAFFAPFGRAKFFRPEWGNSFAAVEGEYSGNVNSHFDGTTLEGDPVTDTNAQSFAHLETDFYYSLQSDLFVYLGLGYRYWNRFLSGGSGYREIYTWAYAPIGVYYRKQIHPQWKWGLDLSYRLMFAGQIKIIFSETVKNGDDNTLEIGNRPGFKIQSPFEYAFPETKFGLLISPWYEVSAIGASPLEYNSTPGLERLIQEPASRTEQFGVALGMVGYF